MYNLFSVGWKFPSLYFFNCLDFQYVKLLITLSDWMIFGLFIDFIICYIFSLFRSKPYFLHNFIHSFFYCFQVQNICVHEVYSKFMSFSLDLSTNHHSELLYIDWSSLPRSVFYPSEGGVSKPLDQKIGCGICTHFR